ncbi:MAG: beta-lactamase family protein [Bacteroidaceae bacterium]|nr:beta-lactamase family protein [Bacteroidaceae bacterium]
MNKLLVLLACMLLSSTTLIARDINIAAIDSFINHIEQHNQGFGSVSIAHNGKMLYTRHYGQKAIPSAPIRYQIGSITKTYTATLIHRLCNKGLLSLDTTLDTFFPGIPSADSITIAHMLNHTSGLADFTVKQDTLIQWLTQPASQQDILQEIERQGVIFAPGTNLRYSNSAYYLLSRIIEQLYQLPYAEVLKREITTPLALNNTHACLQQPLNAATPYRLNTANRWQEVEDFYFPNIIGVGDMVSTTTDLIAFIHALFDGAYVDSASLTHMLPSEGTAFGSGLMLMPFYDHTFYGHAGDTYGTHTAVMYNPSDSIAIAIAINGCATPRNDMLIGICSAIYDMEYEYPDFSQHQQYTASPDELAQYAGHFNSSLIDLPMLITYNEADGNLSLQLRGQPSLWLEAKSPGVFINSPTGVAISFRNPDRFIFKQFGRIIIYTRQ